MSARPARVAVVTPLAPVRSVSEADLGTGALASVAQTGAPRLACRFLQLGQMLPLLTLVKPVHGDPNLGNL